MSYDLKREEEVKQYVENLGIEYRFGCFKEKNPEVCHMLGDYLESIKKDFTKAAKVYKSNCLDYDHGKSCLKIGNYYLTGKGVDKPDFVEALKYFEKGCELNNPTACLHAGMLLTATGEAMAHVKKDPPKGFNYLKKSCDSNDDLACHYLCGMFLSGVPKNFDDYELIRKNPENAKNVNYLIKQNYKEAFKYANKACELGNLYACANVSMMYSKGEGTEKNQELAEKFKKLTIDLQNSALTTKELKFQQGLDDKKK